ncbi:hypothetical protein [Paraclostridium dentum]
MTVTIQGTNNKNKGIIYHIKDKNKKAKQYIKLTNVSTVVMCAT